MIRREGETTVHVCYEAVGYMTALQHTELELTNADDLVSSGVYLV